ncbi:MAG TPA: glycosyltransferase family 2 protein, partial [Candidatus Binatia bacterium]|nr:glycosyltransferase family 2 protein [Candidatus Binatia bacterium]
VMVSPGGPAHVMVSDREAEHIPGCNMAFYKWALEEVGGFDPIFRKAGDDVDLCWRLQQRGHKLGFSPAGFVWHYRRSTVKAYLQQQNGYGEAEALLARKHPEYFNTVGSGVWRGRIYSSSKHGVVLQRSIIYHGTFGSGFFQTLYSPAPSFPLMLCTSLEYYALVTLPLALLSWVFPLLASLAATSLILSLGVCLAAALQAEFPPNRCRFWSRPLVAALFFLQPIERGLARYRHRFKTPARVRLPERLSETAPPLDSLEPFQPLGYWSIGDVDRYRFLTALTSKLEEHGFQLRLDSGWSDFDIEISGDYWTRLRLTTVTEELNQGRRNFRCQLRRSWSLPALLTLASVTAVEIVSIGLCARLQPWIWLLPLTLPFVSLLIEHQQFKLLSATAALISDVADSLKLVPLQPRATDQSVGLTDVAHSACAPA